MAARIPTAALSQSVFTLLIETEAQKLIDPQSGEWMDDAVIFDRCKHTLSQRTADACLERDLPQKHPS